jgi:Ca2+-binding RTX toxin-like protein
MPIWGGQGRNVITATRGADVIHGAGGKDTIRPRMGRDEVWGDAGFDTVVLPGKSARYRLIRMSKNRRTLVIRGFGSRKTLKDVERLKFSNGP